MRTPRQSSPKNPPDLTKGPALAIRTGQITMAEIKKALKNNKNGQAAGCDNIPHKPGKREDWVWPRSFTLS